jgi:N-acetylneuraminate synthase
MPCFIIAEAGVNHNGELPLALDLVDAAAEAGADAVKFQTFQAENVVQPGTEKAEYQKLHTGAGDQYDMIRRLQLDDHAHLAIARRCTERGIEFMSTPFDGWATDLLLGLGMRRIKVASGELTNRPFIEMLAGRGLPMIISTGMASLAEVEEAVRWIREVTSGAALGERLTVLHCTSNYPASPVDVNLRAMVTLRHELGIPVGYSDHTLGTEISFAAVAMGASVIEKHFTLDRSLPGPDHQASLDPEQLRLLVKGIRNIESAFGDGIKRPTDSELPVRALVRRSAIARAAMPAGHALSAADLKFLRPGTGIGPENVPLLEGRRLSRPVAAGQLLAWEDLA